MTQEIVLWPALKSRHIVGVTPDAIRLGVSIFVLAGADSRSNEKGKSCDRRIQCWTNLPDDDDDGRGGAIWRALDVLQWQAPSSDSRLEFNVRQVNVSKARLAEVVETGAPQTYGLTWRVCETPANTTWLGTQDDNVEIVLQPVLLTAVGVKGSRRPVQHLFERHLRIPPDVRLHAQQDCISIYRLDMSSGKEATTELAQFKVAIRAGFTIERTKPTWHTTRHIEAIQDVSTHHLSSLIVLQVDECTADGGEADWVYVFRPVCVRNTTVGLCRSASSDKLCVRSMMSTDLAPAEARVIIACGPLSNLPRLLQRTHEEAQNLLQGKRSIIPYSSVSPLSLHGEGIAFCTWEALATGAARPTLRAVDELLEATCQHLHLPVSCLLIDDGWQDIRCNGDSETSQSVLHSFDMDASLCYPDMTRFATQSERTKCGTLHAYTSSLRCRHPSLRRIGVWMTLAGYWGGLDPQATQLNQAYGPFVQATLHPSPIDQRCGDRRKTWFLPAPNRLDAFWDDYFAALHEAGIDFVKVDDQADWEAICALHNDDDDESTAVQPLDYFYQSWFAMTRAAQRNFGAGRVLHCMALGQAFANGPMGITSSPVIHLRTSDDAFPHIDASHTWHVYHNAMQACLTHAANGTVVADADMIVLSSSSPKPDQARTEAADWPQFHAAFRACFSSATVWLSDDVKGISSESARHITSQLFAPIKILRQGVDGEREESTIQIPRQGESSVPLPGCALQDVTSARTGAALKLGYCRNLPHNDNHIGMLSIWNTRAEGHRAVDNITSRDVADVLAMINSTVKDDDDDDNDDDAVLVYATRRKLAVWITMADVHASRHAPTLTTRPLMPLSLPISGFDVLTIVTVPKTQPVRIACVGLVDKYAGSCALVGVSYSHGSQVDGKATIVIASLTHAGQCGFLCESTSLAADDFVVHVDGDVVAPSDVRVSALPSSSSSSSSSSLLTVDMIQHLTKRSRRDYSEPSWQVSVECILQRSG